MKTISPTALKPLLTGDQEIAFLDVREHGQYGEGHPFFSVNLPYSILEERARLLLPCKQTPVVLMDDNDQVAQKVFRTLSGLGYTKVQILTGGARGWRAAGFNLFKGVNVPSKTFGELVEHTTGTPSISAEELKSCMDSGEPLIVLDGRSSKEFTMMSLPTARSCPNAELAYRSAQLFTDTHATVVINCAGRTRSIIGAESLRQCGIEMPIYALRNGTQGWRLAGFELIHGKTSAALPALTPEQAKQTRQKADSLIQQWELNAVSTATWKTWQNDPYHTSYLLDVRTAEEFSVSHWPGARHAPGGQLVQATDEFVAVRGARIVLCDDTGLRAATTALWLRGMGHTVFILQADVSQGASVETVENSVTINATPLTLQQAATHSQAGAIILDASRGKDFRQSHIDSAIWVTRSRLSKLDCPRDTKLIVTSADPILISGVVTDLKLTGFTDVNWVNGSPELWRSAGFNVVETPSNPSQDDCIDYLFFVHDRHAGNMEAARQYLAWETGLLAQLDEQERGVLCPPSAAIP